MTVIEDFAAFVAADAFDVDEISRSRVRDAIVDGIGCILLGASRDVASKTRAAAVALSLDAGPAPVLGTGLQVPRPTAAFLNAVAGHALDFDDWELPGNTHPTVVLLPALLATATADTSGLELMRSYLAGFEVIVRLGEALNFAHYDKGWHSTATLGALGAAGAVAHLLKLDANETAHALSIAASRASGFTSQFGSDAKPLQAGFAAETGVTAAQMAAAGLTGRLDILEHPRGMNALMANVAPLRLETAVLRLGQPLAMQSYGVVLKPWLGCGYTHRIMTAIQDLGTAVPTPAEIAAVDLHQPDFHAAILPYHHPTQAQEALFSLPFVAALGLAGENFTVSHLDRAAWNEPIIAALIGKITVHPFKPKLPDLNYDPEQPDRITIQTYSGKTVKSACAYPLGAPENPMRFGQILDKFHPLFAEIPESRIEDMKNWPSLPNVLTLLVGDDEEACR